MLHVLLQNLAQVTLREPGAACLTIALHVHASPGGHLAEYPGVGAERVQLMRSLRRDCSIRHLCRPVTWAPLLNETRELLSALVRS